MNDPVLHNSHDIFCVSGAALCVVEGFGVISIILGFDVKVFGSWFD